MLSPEITRREMLAGSVAAAAAASLTTTAPAQEPPPKSRRVAITIDDGPVVGGGNSLDNWIRIADALRMQFIRAKVPVILFINERQFNIDGQRDARVKVLHDWLDAGFDLGNHTYSHPRVDARNLWRYFDDIVKGEVISRPILERRNKKLVWFRYPFLASLNNEAGKAIEDFLTQRGYKVAPVSVDYHDYSFSGGYVRPYQAGNKEAAETQFAAVMAALDKSFESAETNSVKELGYELAQTLLIHCNEMNAMTLDRTIERIRSRGYTFVTMDEAMSDPAYGIPGVRPGGMGGGGLLGSLGAAKRAAAQPPQ
jgi:peptidoglycan/xylan/chitin deacetylase (PgdA/CDA1 family)